MSRPSAELLRAETTPPRRSSARWYETRFCGFPTRFTSSPTRRSLRPNSTSSRQRSGSLNRPRISGGLTSTGKLHQIGLMQYKLYFSGRRQRRRSDERFVDGFGAVGLFQRLAVGQVSTRRQVPVGHDGGDADKDGPHGDGGAHGDDEGVAG